MRTMRRGTAMLALVGTYLLVSCDGGRERPAPFLEPEGTGLFLHHLIAWHAPGGAECCTDVAGLGDINGDGFLDVVIGSQESQIVGLFWFEYPTWQRHPIARGEFTTDGIVVDFDGDGDEDVVVGDMASGVTFLEQVPGVRGWKRHLLATGYIHDLRVADVTGDGRLDVVTTDKHKLELLESRPDGPPVRHVLLEQKGEGLELADLDDDGDLDILFSNFWLQRVGADGQTGWAHRALAPGWPIDTRIQVTDLSGDGRPDVVLAASEGPGGLSWFEAPALATEPWVEHRILDEPLEGAHSLRIADFDLDGDADVLVAEMHTSPRRRIMVALNEGETWRPLILARHGSHNMVVGDVDGDGDVDLVGKNYEGRGRFVELWENRAADLRRTPAAIPADGTAEWRYDPLDVARPAYDREKFALFAADLDGDGDQDVVAGGTLYVNPGQGATSGWSRVTLAPDADVLHATNLRVNGWRTLIAAGPGTVSQLVADDAGGRVWKARWIASLPGGRSQGWAAGNARHDGSGELYFTRGTTLFSLGIPARPDGRWTLARLREGVSEEAVALGDLNGDGADDLVVVDADGRGILWLEGQRGRFRDARRLGASLRWIDRLAVSDVNRDGHPDILFTEESQDDQYNSRVAWLEAPVKPAVDRWNSHTIAVLRSANSLGLTDLDGDGLVDVIVAEHTDLRPGVVAADNYVAALLNRGGDRWVADVIEIGPHSSHLGALPVDLDGDGKIEVLSVGYGQSCCVHRWTRSQAKGPPGAAPADRG